MSYNPFHAGQTDASEQRSASDVFKTSAEPAENAIASRFASSGKFTSEQLEAGDDEGANADEPEFDPDDKRPLYERLKAQRDAKQEDFEQRHQFKNQMDHWKLDEDEAAFEDERLLRQQQQQAEASRLHEEGAQFYKLAREARETTRAVPSAAPPPSHANAAAREKRKPPPPSRAKPTFKVLKADSGVAAPTAAGAGAGAASSIPTAAEGEAAPGLPGMALYDDSSEDDED